MNLKEKTVQRICPRKSSPVDGSWGAWQSWSQCSRTCGGGMKEKVRSCNSPAPVNGGEYCTGKNSQSRICNNNQCMKEGNSIHFSNWFLAGPVSGSWGSWADWSQCSQTCGGGRKTRQRLCDSPAPLHGGRDCDGEHSQQKQCNTHQCQVPGRKIDTNNILY